MHFVQSAISERARTDNRPNISSLTEQNGRKQMREIELRRSAANYAQKNLICVKIWCRLALAASCLLREQSLSSQQTRTLCHPGTVVVRLLRKFDSYSDCRWYTCKRVYKPQSEQPVNNIRILMQPAPNKTPQNNCCFALFAVDYYYLFIFLAVFFFFALFAFIYGFPFLAERRMHTVGEPRIQRRRRIYCSEMW